MKKTEYFCDACGMKIEQKDMFTLSLKKTTSDTEYYCDLCEGCRHGVETYLRGKRPIKNNALDWGIV